MSDEDDASQGLMQPPDAVFMPGLYHGEIVDVEDPEERRRYRVRVHAIHPPEVAVNCIPWADLCTFGGKGFGDFPAYKLGDCVYVMFLGAVRKYPIIMGGWLTKSDGLNDLPGELAGDYVRNKERWTRVDRRGNKVELSPNPDENWVHLQSGDSEIFLSQSDKSVRIKSKTRLTAESNTIEQTAQEFLVTVGNNGIITIDKDFTITSQKQLDLHAKTTVNIGEYRDPMWPVTAKRTTSKINIKAVDNILEQTDKTLQRKVGTSLTSEVGTTYAHKTGTTHKVQSGQKMTVTVLAGGYDTVVKQGDLKVDVQAGNLTATVTGNTKVDTTGTTDILSNGAINIKSNSTINMEAPVIKLKAATSLSEEAPITSIKGTANVKIEGGLVDVKASSLCKIAGGSLCKIDAGLILIG